MPLDLPLPIIYLITKGTTTAQTTSDDADFSNILRLVEAAVAAEVSLFQIREKALRARVLYDLTIGAARITQGTATRLLVNDRSDVARAARADGVHLTSRSLPANVVRQTCGADFLIGVSTHSRQEARAAQVAGASFVVYGPVFDTESKRVFGEPQGLAKLQEVTGELRGFPVLAIGGINLDNFDECFRAGASGIAAIRLLNDAAKLRTVVDDIRVRSGT